jgi:hypothetical protein
MGWIIKRTETIIYAQFIHVILKVNDLAPLCMYQPSRVLYGSSKVKDTLKCSWVGGKHGDLGVRLQSSASWLCFCTRQACDVKDEGTVFLIFMSAPSYALFTPSCLWCLVVIPSAWQPKVCHGCCLAWSDSMLFLLADLFVSIVIVKVS